MSVSNASNASRLPLTRICGYVPQLRWRSDAPRSTMTVSRSCRLAAMRSSRVIGSLAFRLVVRRRKPGGPEGVVPQVPFHLWERAGGARPVRREAPVLWDLSRGAGRASARTIAGNPRHEPTKIDRLTTIPGEPRSAHPLRDRVHA